MRKQRPKGRKSPHGTNNRYLAGCSCLACCDAHNEYTREWVADKKAGIARTVDGDLVRARIAKLRKQGMSRRAIAECAGVSYTTVQYIENLTSVNVRRDTAEAIFGVEPRPYNSSALIPSGPTLAIIEKARKLRLRSRLAVEAGLSSKSSLPRPTQKRVWASLALRIEQAAERLGLMPAKGGSSVPVDTELLLAHIGERPIAYIEDDAGLASGAVAHVLRRRSCSELTLCAIASVLGVRDTDLIERQAS